MAVAHSPIEWTDATWSPVTGCSKVSPGCAHCYAETIALRFWKTQYPPVAETQYMATQSIGDIAIGLTYRPRQFTDVRCHEDRLDAPLHWKKPRMVFVNSMSDLFHEEVSDTFILAVFSVMEQCPQHTFQILTKRAERMRDIVAWLGRKWADDQRPYTWPLPNVWLGVSVENQHFADERIPLLLQTPAAIRFISAEPLLGPVKLDHMDVERVAGDQGYYFINALTGRNDDMGRPCRDVPKLDWVIVGGESGPAARPCDLAWARSIVQQCQAAGVPVFVKQLGTNPHERVSRGIAPSEPLIPYVKLRDRKGGTPSEWPSDLRIREFPEAMDQRR